MNRTWKAVSLVLTLVLLLTLAPPMAAQADEDVITELDITYDASAAFPTVRATGQQVSLALFKAVTSPKSGNYSGADWYIYGNPDGGTTSWCSLCYANGNGFTENFSTGFTSLFDSDEPLTADKEYYLRFNPCRINKNFDQENLPTVTVNGSPADRVYRNGETELVVYQRVEMNETGDFLWQLSLEPTEVAVQKGTTYQFTAEPEGTADTSVAWSVLGANKAGTTVSSTGLLTVAADETAESVTVRAEAGIFVREATVSLTDEVPYIGGVAFTDLQDNGYKVKWGNTIRLYAEVSGTDLPSVDWSLSGNTCGDTYLGSESPSGRISGIVLNVGKAERAEALTVRATSRVDPSKFAEITVTVLPVEQITSLNIAYDAQAMAAVLNTAHTGREVSIAQYAAIIGPTSTAYAGSDWYIYGNPDGGFSSWCCLCYANENAFTEYYGTGFTTLYDSDEPLTADKEYYLKFNPSRHNKDFDQANLPTVTVNGSPADRVYRNGDIELVVYQRVYLAEQGHVSWSFNDGVLTITGTGAMDAYTGDSRPWESYKNQITSVVVGEGVTSVGAWAFYSLPNLTSVSLPSTLKTVGDWAFRNSRALTAVTLPAGVTSIGIGAFMDCTGLTSFVIPGGVTAVSGNAFQDCTGLTEVTIPASVTAVGSYAFSGCANLEQVHYLGTAEQWESVSISTGNQPLLDAIGTPLEITQQPENYTGSIGETATFHVAASGSELSYQWQFLSGDKWYDTGVDGNKTDTITVEITSGRLAYQYRCVVKDGSGNTVVSNAAQMVLP